MGERDGTVASGDYARLAREAWLLVVSDPARAQHVARQALAHVEDRSGAAAAATASLAHRALGMAALELDDADTSVAHLRRSIAAAGPAGDPGLVAEAEMSLALALQHRGEGAAALRHAGTAHELAPGSARLGLQRALLFERLGRSGEALAAYAETEGLAAACGDRHTLVRVHCNRGVLRTYRGAFPGAERDLLLAEALCGELGLTAMAAGVRSNLGFLAARRGNMVESLGRMEASRAEMEALGGLRHGIHELDRCEVLLLAGLPGDAAEAGRVAMAILDGAGMAAEAAEARVLTATAALRGGRAAEAEALATVALTALTRQRRAPWMALAREIVVRAQWAGGRRDAALLERARRVADALADAGWPAAAASARLLSAQLALDLGRTGRALTELRRAAGQRGGPVAARVQARHATALLRLLEGDRPGAEAALRAGWLALEHHRATLGATELRVGAGSHAVELAQLGLRLAVEAGRPGQALTWAERGRAGALAQPPARAPQDPALAEALEALRATVADLDDAAKQGDDTRALLRRQATLEGEVRRRAQLAVGGEPGSARRVTLPPAELAALVGDRALVELAAVGDDLVGVVVTDGRLTLHELGSAARAERETRALCMALRRLARGGTPEPLLRAARAAADLAAAALAAQLLAPLRCRIESRALVLVPTGALHGTPWPVLPGIARSLTVAPSAALWARTQTPQPSSDAHGRAGSRASLGPVDAKRTVACDASRTTAAPGRFPAAAVLVAAGPHLAHADREVEAVGALHPGARVMLAEDATVVEIRDRLPGATMAHLACHGRFRADNPLFSALEFTGGRLSVFELEQLGQVPERLVLSACDSGLSAVRPGDELMGLTAAVLRLGTRSLVASVLPVPDAASRRLMVVLHRGLVAGLGPADALAAARAAGDPDDDHHRVASAAFLAFGAG